MFSIPLTEERSLQGENPEYQPPSSLLPGIILQTAANIIKFTLKNSGPVSQNLRAILCLRPCTKSLPAACSRRTAPASSTRSESLTRTALLTSPGRPCTIKTGTSASAYSRACTLWSFSISSWHNMPPFTNYVFYLCPACCGNDCAWGTDRHPVPAVSIKTAPAHPMPLPTPRQ